MNYEIRIKLKSDLCVSSGESFGSLVDNDICYDKYGIPYIPAKRIKGLLVEQAEEYCDWAGKNRKYIEGIFGSEGVRNSSRLVIDNAYIKGYDSIVSGIENIDDEYRKYVTPQRVLDVYTYTRYQTAIDEKTGTSKENSLRSTRVIKAKDDSVFIAKVSVDLPENDIETLKIITKLVSHMGINRTRGFGEVYCQMCDVYENAQTESITLKTAEDKAKIKILLRANSNIMVPKQESENSKSYISGSNILGSIAKKYIQDNAIKNFSNITEEYIDLFLNGKVKYSNAYISDEDETQYFPIPFSYAKVKNTSNVYYNKMFDIKDDNIQLSSIGNKFVTLDDKESYIKEVELEENYHHQRPKDKTIGHVITGEDGGTLYQYVSISPKQYFLATIEGDKKSLEKILKYIKKGDTLRVGKSKNTEYGNLEIVNVREEKIDNEKREYNKFAVVLTSDMILMKDGKISIDKKVLEDKLKNVLGENIKLEKAFINYDDVSGYNIIWNLPKEQMQSYKAGSVLVFEGKCMANKNYTLGCKQNEGYGNIMLLDIENKNEHINLERKAEKIYKKNENNDKSFRYLLLDSMKNVLYEEILESATNVKNTLNNSTIGRLMLMLKQSETVKELYENIDTIKDDKKLKEVKKMLDGKQEEILNMQSYKDFKKTKGFGKENIKEENKFDNDTMMEYIKQFLIQARIGGEK